MNQADVSTTTTSTFFKPGDFNDSTNYFVRAYYDTIINGVRKHGDLYLHTYYDSSIVFTNDMNYAPSLYINPSDPYQLNIRTGDPQNPVFGFLKKRGRVSTSQSDPNYSRLIIRDSLNGQTILQNNWPDSYLEHLGFTTVNGIDNTNKEKLGETKKLLEQ